MRAARMLYALAQSLWPGKMSCIDEFSVRVL
jgi:hypothetical protein